ncbi:MAG: DUF1801 domain-containing protein [Paracoccaceae bacterium]|nr:DUF1801 domain-containing protein [Paracoccaceae bacterium]
MSDEPVVMDFLNSISPARRAEEAKVLNALFQDLTGWHPKLWRGNILGYGSYDYTYKSGRSGTYLATGFAPRKAKLSVYIMPGYANFSDILTALGKHKIGKSCLYINKLQDVDLGVLKTLICAGLDDLATRWPIHPT